MSSRLSHDSVHAVVVFEELELWILSVRRETVMSCSQILVMISGPIGTVSMLSKSAGAAVLIDSDNVSDGGARFRRPWLSISFLFPGSFCTASTDAGLVVFWSCWIWLMLIQENFPSVSSNW